MGRVLDLRQGLEALMCHHMVLGTTEFHLELLVIDLLVGILDQEHALERFLLCLDKIQVLIESLELGVVLDLRVAVEINMLIIITRPQIENLTIYIHLQVRLETILLRNQVTDKAQDMALEDQIKDIHLLLR